MRNPSGAEDTGSEDVGVAVSVAGGVAGEGGTGNAVEVDLITVRVGEVVGVEVTVPQAPTINMIKVMENTINFHFAVFINIIIANSRVNTTILIDSLFAIAF